MRSALSFRRARGTERSPSGEIPAREDHERSPHDEIPARVDGWPTGPARVDRLLASIITSREVAANESPYFQLQQFGLQVGDVHIQMARQRINIHRVGCH